ncbi:inositol monophosphatase family protein [Radiobacillus deserti]|uniref:inositol-phosphate phosphatase n=1 Tax=Radiobacillus deserti TaxID=2594883 RepID=A0A516KFB0_9BACI|nr:inositol monophosphatase family protein [Radiobacillus deserti]QDP40047.1 inositol monophosphatase family protein [Radiobacillus deserti]
MDADLKQDIYNQAIEWIREAGDRIRESIGEPLTIDTKSNPNDLVTQMDKNTEKFFVEKIKGKYAHHHLISEEGFGDKLNTMDGVVWIIDPIDGTMNFVHQKRNFAISIGIYVDGIGEIGLIYDVMDDILYSAKRGEGAYKNGVKLPALENKRLEESILALNSFWTCENRAVNEKKMQELVKKVRGTRSYGSAALEFAYLAEGILDGYVTMKLAPWDIAAGVILVQEVGGTTTKADGQPLDLLKDNTILSANQTIHEEIYSSYIELK